ncbi:6-pyruvoyl tetrahydropterin synthase family protein [Planctomycetota bacterium]
MFLCSCIVSPLLIWSVVLFTVTVETSFRASHQLTLPDGSKEKIHHHNWQVAAQVSSEKLNKRGLVMDFCRLRAALESVLSDFGGVQMEELAFFRQNNSSAENVAKYIHAKLQAKLPKDVKLNDITVVEEPGCWARFEK